MANERRFGSGTASRVLRLGSPRHRSNLHPGRQLIVDVNIAPGRLRTPKDVRRNAPPMVDGATNHWTLTLYLRASSTSLRDGFATLDTSGRQRRIAGYEEAVGMPLFHIVS